MRPLSEMRLDLIGAAERGGRSLGFRTLARLAGCQRKHAAASLVSGCAGIAGRERLTRADLTGESVVFRVGAGRTMRVDHPAHRGAGHDSSQRTTTERRAGDVVEMLVDALRLPLAIDAAHRVGQLGIVAAGIADRTFQTLSQRGDDRGRQRLDGTLGRRRRD